MEMTPECLHFSLPSNPRYLPVLRALFGSLLSGYGFSRRDTMGVVLAVNEAYANVIEHCYQGDVTRRIDITVRLAPEEITVEMRDYGEQPDLDCIKPRALDELRPGGLGTHFMHTVMDDVTYDLSFEQGTLLRMIKRRR